MQSKSKKLAAIQLGAFDYLTKPVDFNRVRILVERAIDKHVLSRRLERLEEILIERESSTLIVGDSPVMQDVRELITSVAASDATVLILGDPKRNRAEGGPLAGASGYSAQRSDQGMLAPVLPLLLVEAMMADCVNVIFRLDFPM